MATALAERLTDTEITEDSWQHREGFYNPSTDTDRMFVDTRYQRKPAASIKTILRAGWNPHLVGTLTGSQRRNGRIAIVEGRPLWTRSISHRISGNSS